VKQTIAQQYNKNSFFRLNIVSHQQKIEKKHGTREISTITAITVV